MSEQEPTVSAYLRNTMKLLNVMTHAEAESLPVWVHKRLWVLREKHERALNETYERGMRNGIGGTE